MPDVVATLIEEPDPQAPLGAKGVGEPPCISVTPAIVAAIRDATGRRRSTPGAGAPAGHRLLSDVLEACDLRTARFTEAA